MKLFFGSTIFLISNLLLSASAFAQTYDVSGVKLLMTPDQVTSALSENGYEPNYDPDLILMELDYEKMLEAVEAGEDPFETEQNFRRPANKKMQFTFDRLVSIEASSLEVRNQNLVSSVNNLLHNPKQRILDAQKNNKDSVVKHLYFQKNENRETIAVEFSAYPSGPYVNRITYRLYDRDVPTAEFREKVLKKYGRFNAGRTWVGEGPLEKDGIEGREVLSSNSRHVSLHMKNSTSYGKVYRAAVEAAKNGSKPKDHKAKTINKGTSF